MSGSLAMAVVLAAAAAALAVPPAPGVGRLRRPVARSRRAPARLAGPVCAAALVWAVGGPVALLPAVGLIGAAAVRERSRAAAVRHRAASDAPLALELLAACLGAGGPLDPALRAVAGALPGPVGAALGAVAAARRVGAGATAWQALDDETLPPAVRAAGRLLDRCERSGAAPAAELRRLAELARESRRQAGEARARRSAVAATAPLVCCFLPAFVLLGVVPLVAALARVG